MREGRNTQVTLKRPESTKDIAKMEDKDAGRSSRISRGIAGNRRSGSARGVVSLSLDLSVRLGLGRGGRSDGQGQERVCGKKGTETIQSK